jgi:dipeptidyl-peptidase-4
VAAAPVDAQAPPRALTIDAIFDPATRVNFSGTPATNITWIDADSYLLVQRGSNGFDWLKVDAASGRSTPLFDAGRMENAIAALPGITRAEASEVARSNDLTLNPARTGVLFSLSDDLYFYDFGSAKATRLTSTPGEEEEATFSPDGRQVAFVRGNNLKVIELASQRETALTTDGSNEILNGKLDWLYQEEIYGRGRFRGYWWSPDSSRLAFLQLDERPVPEYTVTDHIPYRPRLEVTDYPKAGDPNPKVRLGVSRVAGGDPGWIDLTAYSAVDILIVNVDWTPSSSEVVFQVQDREQTWLDLNLANAGSAHARKVLRETTKAWVNENGNPVWLKDGSFLWFSERSGFKHLYQYKTDGTLVRQVTSGRWDVRSLYGVDEATGVLYFPSSERSAIGTDIYRIRLDGTAMTRLSQTPGTHRAIFNPGYTRYVGIWSDVTTPTQVRLHRADGTEMRVIDANPAGALAEYRLSKPEFIEVKARDGFVLDAMMIKPPDFNPARRYPVYQFTYAGPTAALVRNQWGGQTYMYHQLLAQQDVIVWVLDNRSAGAKGAEAQWPVYGNLGEFELRDLEDGVAWLKQQPYVDASRLLLHGWSYGGFMTAYALTHSTSWSAGIVGAPVTDWRDYDTVYTERLMKMPQNNPDGYRRSAPRFAADKLQAKMLLIHGLTDDNVHVQNSVQFAYELQHAGKLFEEMFYARSRHAFSDQRLERHRYQTMFDFIMRTIGNARPAAPPTSQ